jgi:hypothetical protein
MSRRLRCRDRLVSHGVTMRVAIITESFPPDVNGVAHCVLRVAELLASGGHHPLVIAPQPPRAKRDEGASYPFPVVRVPAVPLPGYPAPGGELIAGYVGRLATEKQVDLLSGITALEGVRLVIVGAGPAEDALRRQMPGAVFLGERRGEELAAIYASLDVFVHSGPYETFGQTLQEAAASGLPVVAPAAGGPLDLVTDGVTGFLVPPSDPDAFTAAVARLVADPVMRTAFGAAGRRKVATALRPDVASVVVGINDTLRGDFDPERTGASVGRTVAALQAAGAEVLTMRLPDPGQMFGLPGALARPLARRMRAVNAAVDEVARRHGTVHLDAARDPATYERCYWSVDRLHPNERGHRLIACRFHALLAAAGFPVGPGLEPEPSGAPPTRLAEVGWMATKGTAWLVRRSRDLVPTLAGLALREWLGGHRGRPAPGPDDAERDDIQPERVNLNALSRPSGNLRPTNGLPSAALKVRNRSLTVTKGT